MRTILRLVMYITVLGLFSNLILHISGFFGGIPLAQAAEVARYLYQVMIVVTLISIFVSNHTVKNYLPRDFWKAALRGCPKWLKYLPLILFVYANLFYFIHGSFSVPESAKNMQVGCAFYMSIYALCLALLYSALQIQYVDKVRRCPNGHNVPSDAKFCEECGSRVIEF
jgi:uncharacterized membrane protein YtjA (UPF0391 family)